MSAEEVKEFLERLVTTVRGALDVAVRHAPDKPSFRIFFSGRFDQAIYMDISYVDAEKMAESVVFHLAEKL